MLEWLRDVVIIVSGVIAVIGRSLVTLLNIITRSLCFH